jgi:cytochrome P450
MQAAMPDYSRYDPYSKEVMADPQPFYRYLRAHSPVLYLDKYDLWVFSRFQNIIDVLSIGDNTFIASESTLPGPSDLLRHNHGQVKELPLEPVLPIGALLGSPHYDVLRQAHIKPFRPRTAASLGDLVRALANQQLDSLLSKGRFDLTQDYGGIVAASVICHLYDMPESLAREVLDLVNQLSLTDPEVGGTDVAATVGKSVAVMLQLAAVRGDLDAHVPKAVEEMIRFCAPAQWFLRTAHKDVTVAGHDIKIGQRVMMLFGSAGRDDDEFEDPDSFIWNRRIKRQLAFGYGQHFCIGVHLARVELRLLVHEFLRRVPAYSFDMNEAVRLPSSFQWGWNKLPVMVG